MAANIFTYLLALALIVCPFVAPVYDAAGFDTTEIIQTAEEITGTDYPAYASVPVKTAEKETITGPVEVIYTPPEITPNIILPPPEKPGKLPGSELISGVWHGTKSLFFGAASADFTLSAEADGNMTISGTAEAPIAGYGETPFTLDAKWQYLGSNRFTGEAQGSSLDFTCDGTKISLTANPYELGFIDNEMADMDIDIVLTRVHA